MRMCIDFRALNARTVRDSYPLPRVEDLLDRLAMHGTFQNSTCAVVTIRWP